MNYGDEIRLLGIGDGGAVFGIVGQFCGCVDMIVVSITNFTFILC
jgi:hypothetical protein